MPHSADHFEGKSVFEHLKEARTKGAMAAAEIHGTEMPGHIAGGADAAKESAMAALILWAIGLLVLSASQTFGLLLLFFTGWLIWKCGRSALLGWARMERLHRLIEEERWEIEHHRSQERQELAELYRAKGFTGKLLEEVVDVLMADDNRLLNVMLEEELGLTLEAYEHPLKQSAGAGVGVILSAGLLLFAHWAFPHVGIPLAAGLILITAATIAARLERNRPLNAVVWNLAIGALSAGSVYFIGQLIHK
ncbi:MAG: VIT1/CCC1 transporter family protein [Parachlamydiales bacterium]